jgi:hypothetical protein
MMFNYLCTSVSVTAGHLGIPFLTVLGRLPAFSRGPILSVPVTYWSLGTPVVAYQSLFNQLLLL